MRWAKIRTEDIANGPGFRVSIYVQGCNNHCPGCFNPETWDFEGGREFTDKVKSKFLELGKSKKIAGFSILGGEPLQQGEDMLDLVKEIKETYPDKTIWMWTGCVYEELTPEQLDIVKYVDVLIDGRFDMEHKTPRSRYKGSFNQRVIDVAKTLKANKCVLHEFNYS